MSMHTTMRNVLKKHTNRSRGIVTLETIAIALLVVLVLVVVIAILFSPTSEVDPDADGTATDVREAPENSVFTNPGAGQVDREQGEFSRVREDSPFADDGSGRSFNEKIYEEQKEGYEKLALSDDEYLRGFADKDATGEHRVTARINEVNIENGLTLQLTSLQENTQGLPIIIVYDESVLPKINVINATLENLKPGDEVYIDETNNYTLPYQESIQQVNITVF